MSAATTSQPPLSLDDYARIHGIVLTVLAGTGVRITDIQKSCIFFALAGAYLLERKHGLRSNPQAGAAFLVVGKRNDTLDILTFAKRDDAEGEWYSDESAFHAWVEVVTDDGQQWLIDFTAPMYPDAIRRLALGAAAPSKAFVRSKAEMLSHPDELPFASPGDFFLHPSSTHTAQMMQRAARDAQLGDLMDLINHWYVRCPAKIAPSLHMGSNAGTTRRLTFTQPRLAGYWSSPPL